MDAEVEEAIEKVEIQAEEMLHGSIETNAIPILDELRSGGNTFWSKEDGAQIFSHFIALQHLRTRRTRDATAAGFAEGLERDRFFRVWPILRHILATNIGWSLYADRKRMRVRVLLASDGSRFITSDQPTINLLNPKINDGFALFYPTSPRTAALLELNDQPSAAGLEDDLPSELIKALNSKILDYALDQIYSDDIDYLKSIVG